MAERHTIREQRYTKEGNLVIPIDELRTYDKGNLTTFTSGTDVNGYVCASGKVCYLRELLVTELSGHQGRIWLEDATGTAIIPPINIVENSTVSWTPNEAFGPFTSGFTVANQELWGQATLIVQIDPQQTE